MYIFVNPVLHHPCFLVFFFMLSHLVVQMQVQGTRGRLDASFGEVAVAVVRVVCMRGGACRCAICFGKVSVCT